MLDFDLLAKSINHLFKSNDAFQTRLFLENGEVKQYFCDFEEVKIPIYEITSIEDFIKEDAKRTNIYKNLIETPLYEFVLFKYKGTSSGGIILNFHHIICDAITAALSIRQISETYNSLVQGKGLPNINPDKFSYIQYLNSENEYISSDKFIKDRDYWQKIYETVPDVATIFSSKKTKDYVSPDAERLISVVDGELIRKIKELCEELKISIYNFFMAVFGIYLSKASRLNDFVIGTPILNRTNYREKNTCGMFISTIPFRITLDNNSSFSDYASKISQDTLSMLRHQKYSYEYILQDLRKRDPNLPNLYNVMLSYQITRASDTSCNYTTDWVTNNCIGEDLDIHIYDLNDADLINIAYDYNTNKYEKSNIELIHPRIMQIIKQVLEKKDILLKDIDIVTPNEKLQIINEFNNTKTEYPSDKSVIDLFEEQVLKNPNDIAVCFENNTLTYKELNAKANSLASFLKRKNIGLGDSVAMYLDKSLEAIVSIIATLKLGACYMPIDISYPEDRIKFMINDAKAKVLLTTSNLNFNIDINIPKIIVDLNSDIYSKNTDFMPPKIKPSDLAYIIYTSGSTGKPKGVMVCHKNIVRLVKNTNYITFSKGDRILQTGSIAFDASTFEIWGALLNGLELFLLKKEDLLNPVYFADYIKRNKITILFLTTALFNKFSETDPKMFNTLKYLFVGGEAYSFRHFKLVKDSNPHLTFSHVYGPTENTTFSTYYDIKDTSSGIIPIGTPLANSTCYVVSNSGTLQPINTPGELWVGGDGLSLGYLNREDLNSEKFIPNPFGEGYIYKTGDLVYLLPDGNINYIGRIDNQIKLRGFRIELSEIDSKILTYPGIKESVTVINSNQICSYIISNETISLDKLTNYLKGILPVFMIPNFIMQLDSLPLNVNGKVDKKKLPTPSLINADKKIIPARNEIDKLIIEELKNTIHVDNISIGDSFFGIGGDSLNAITLCTHLSSKLNINISIKDIFDKPIIKDLSDFVANNNIMETNQTITKAEKRENYPLSSAQTRIYYANTVAYNEKTLYNVSGGILFDTLLDSNKLQLALNELVSLHSSFRTSFKYVNGELMQSISENVDINLETEYSSLDAKTLTDAFPKPFDLSKAPLLRAKLYILDNNKSLLLLDTHHIIVDGTSLSLIFDELCKLYEGKKVNNKELRYVDYAVWEKDFISSPDIKPYEDFWTERFKNYTPSPLNLPYDYPLSSVKSFKGNTISMQIDKEKFQKIENLAKANNVSSYSVFLTALFVLLNKYTMQEDITIGSPFAGRSFKELKDLVRYVY